MEQDRKPTYIWSTKTKDAVIYNEKKTVSSIYNGKKTVSFTSRQLHVKEWNYSNLYHHTRKNPQNGLDLNIRPGSLKLLEENISWTLSDINHSNVFTHAPPRVMKIKTKLNK